MIVTFDNVSTKEGIRNLNLSLDLSRVTVLFDPTENLSRAILNSIVGLDEIHDGEISVDGIRLQDFLCREPQISNFGYVFDEGIMLSNLSLKENLMLPLRWINPNLNEAETENLIQSWLNTFGLKLDITQRPVVYRPGPLKLLSIVRTLLIAPKVLIIDDPYYILNKKERDVVYRVLRLLKNSYPMLIASIDDDFGAVFADEIIDLSAFEENFVLGTSLS
jgi:ABC-type lipoprotein export system ATPase subunit